MAYGADQRFIFRLGKLVGAESGEQKAESRRAESRRAESRRLEGEKIRRLEEQSKD